ncbi:MAG: undecaprenyl-diphosphate phosphatase [Actinobacteria bacterium]|nr:undecaprenyl-diphosphate phosphatase [Actinomycetota bacterium]
MSEWFIAVFLGVVQGLTEFLPISSTAHIFLISEIFGWGDPGAAFTAVIQLGTEAAVLIYFWRDISHLLVTFLKSLTNKTVRRTQDATLAWALVLGSIPIGVAGYLLKDFIEKDVRNVWVVASALIVFGFVLIFVERFAFPRKSKMTIGAGLFMGIAQTLALIPGVSRSGATISAGIAIGLERKTATRYAFLLAVPAVFASGVYELRSALSESVVADISFSWSQILVATTVSFTVGLFVIAGLMRFLSKYTFSVFGYYRIALGVILLALASSGVIV